MAPQGSWSRAHPWACASWRLVLPVCLQRRGRSSRMSLYLALPETEPLWWNTGSETGCGESNSTESKLRTLIKIKILLGYPCLMMHNTPVLLYRMVLAWCKLQLDFPFYCDSNTVFSHFEAHLSNLNHVFKYQHFTVKPAFCQWKKKRSQSVQSIN